MVVQYGDLITGESMNVGVFAYAVDGDGRVRSRFIRDLARVRAAFGRDEILEWWLENAGPAVVDMGTFEHLRRSVDSPYSSLRLTEPRGSLEDPDALVEWAARTFLVEPPGL